MKCSAQDCLQGSMSVAVLMVSPTASIYRKLMMVVCQVGEKRCIFNVCLYVCLSLFVCLCLCMSLCAHVSLCVCVPPVGVGVGVSVCACQGPNATCYFI